MSRSTRRYLGSWTLPSGNACNAYLDVDGLRCEWDVQPSPSWPAEDIAHWKTTTFPAICKAVQDVTGLKVLGVQP